MKKYAHLIYSAIGLVALALILVAFNYLLSRVPGRVDLTNGKLYTLSDGTRKILRNLQSPVKVKLYISQGESVPVQLRSFAQNSPIGGVLRTPTIHTAITKTNASSNSTASSTISAAAARR